MSRRSEPRDAISEGARIRVDANGAWTADEATLKLGAMEASGLELAEEPVSGLEELALVRSRTAVPIAADESLGSPVRCWTEPGALGACAVAATIKLAKVGGFQAARRIAAVASDLPLERPRRPARGSPPQARTFAGALSGAG